MIIDHVELQRAAEGFPLDDVIVHAHDLSGNAGILEIQVKRSINFAPSDDVFKSVVAQVAKAARKPDFWGAKHELAVATARTSRKIDGAYQDVLTWARQIQTAQVFADRIAREGSASEDMRTFVNVFRSHLQEFGFPHDDETVWKLLRRVQILIFDYTATGSASEALARERAARALHPSEAARGGELWEALTNLALNIAASGGDRTRETLRNDINLQGFKWAAEPRHLLALAALAENGAAALADIRDQINGVSIGRPERVAEVHASLELGRYVEIRGDAGVGKSGILKHFATQAQIATGIIVLKPGRTARRGWTALRDEIGFDGSARELLSELSADGTGLLFIDNLDQFTAEERATVNDLIRAAATVPGFSVVATARRDFEVDEVGWLAQDGLSQLGRAPPVVINELDDTEVSEMAAAAPALAALLASSHPARDVTRNLFRLARLASRSPDAPLLRTETDMAGDWWDTADGPSMGRRERQRVLRHLAEQALSAVAVFDVSTLPSEPVDSLIDLETLREYGNDRVGFRHDVLREWAVAKFIELDSGYIDRLPLDKPAPAYLARSVELYARSLIERGDDDFGWSSLLGTLSQSGVHGTWRRAVLLALVRSEAAARALATAQARLLADNGVLLNELIRTTTAVDAQAARDVFVGSDIDLEALGSFVVPTGPSWSRLIHWVLGLGDAVPAGSLPDVVDLFSKWSMSTFGSDPLTPRLLSRLHRWLTAIEGTQDVRGCGRTSPLFEGHLPSDQVSSLEIELRRGFVMFARRVPKLAADYLRAAKFRRMPDHVIHELQKFRGTLAYAAPDELADLFEAALIPASQTESRGRYSRRSTRDRVFTDFDSQYLPVSPAQGPFYDLLTAAPNTGNRLIRRLLDHAIASQTRDYTGHVGSIEIALPQGPRRFTSLHTFLWPREQHSSLYAVSSGLMALEAWAHRRIEAGEAIWEVVADILGEGDAPAAYLLIVVDVLLSHWPASKEAAIPFVACPRLLVMDRERQVLERIEHPDLFGLKGIEREPPGLVSAKSLSERPSRNSTLCDLLKHYTFDENPEHRDRLVALLQEARAKLPVPGPDANLGNPEFMVLHALNQLDQANWSPAEYRLDDGRKVKAQQYVPPQSEAEHLAPFQLEAEQRRIEIEMQLASAKVLESPGLIAPDAIDAMVDWAMARPVAGPDQENENGRELAWALRETMMNIAVIAMRDGDEVGRRKSREWAHRVFADRLAEPIDRMAGPSDRLQYNALALSFAGLAFSLRDRADEGDIRRLLEIASHDSSAASPGLKASAVAIAQIDDRLLKSVLRCGLRARVYCHPNWEPEDDETQKAELRREIDAGIDEELDWVAGRGPEPGWPELPMQDPSPRRGIRIGSHVREEARAPGARHGFYADSQGAAAWLRALEPVTDVSQRPWLRDIINHYRAWTSNANGGSLDEDQDVDREPIEWNHAYFSLMAACLPGLTVAEVDTFALDLVI